jgi:cytochrome c553
VTRSYFERSAQFETGQRAEDMRAVASGKGSDAAIDRLSAYAAVQRAATHHLRGDPGQCRPCRERAAAIGQGGRQLPHPAA